MTTDELADDLTFTTREPVYDVHNLPDDGWANYLKTVPTAMRRMPGPFTVDTGEGDPAYCQDGYLAVDARGQPYPIAADEQALIYRPQWPEGLPEVRVTGPVGRRTVLVNGQPVPGVSSYSIEEAARGVQHVTVTIPTDDAVVIERYEGVTSAAT